MGILMCVKRGRKKKEKKWGSKILDFIYLCINVNYVYVQKLSHFFKTIFSF